jgi:hypothetical protein
LNNFKLIIKGFNIRNSFKKNNKNNNNNSNNNNKNNNIYKKKKKEKKENIYLDFINYNKIRKGFRMIRRICKN